MLTFLFWNLKGARADVLTNLVRAHNVDVVVLALPAESATCANDVEPSLKVTVPVGVPKLLPTAACNATGCP